MLNVCCHGFMLSSCWIGDTFWNFRKDLQMSSWKARQSHLFLLQLICLFSLIYGLSSVIMRAYALRVLSRTRPIYDFFSIYFWSFVFIFFPFWADFDTTEDELSLSESVTSNWCASIFSVQIQISKLRTEIMFPCVTFWNGIRSTERVIC